MLCDIIILVQTFTIMKKTSYKYASFDVSTGTLMTNQAVWVVIACRLKKKNVYITDFMKERAVSICKH